MTEAAAIEFEAQAAECMARANIREGSKPIDITREQQDLVNLAGEHRVSAHKIRQILKRRFDKK